MPIGCLRHQEIPRYIDGIERQDEALSDQQIDHGKVDRDANSVIRDAIDLSYYQSVARGSVFASHVRCFMADPSLMVSLATSNESNKIQVNPL